VGKPAEHYPTRVGKDPNKVPYDCPRGRGHDPEREHGVRGGMPCCTGCNILFVLVTSYRTKGLGKAYLSETAGKKITGKK